MSVAYTFGFRKGELLCEMKVDQLDCETRTIRLDPGTTKNNQGRVVVMTGEVYDLLRACVEGKGPDDFVFTRKDGNVVRNFRGAWYALCVKAGLGRFVKREGKRPKWEGLIFHDLRRSAVRNMVRRGVSETVAMRISGHKTRDVFARYNITSVADLADAARLIERGKNAKILRFPETNGSELATGSE
jgi:integrase